MLPLNSVVFLYVSSFPQNKECITREGFGRLSKLLKLIQKNHTTHATYTAPKTVKRKFLEHQSPQIYIIHAR